MRSLSSKAILTSCDWVHAAPDVGRDLRDCLARLPEAERLVLVLRHALDRSIEEIAELTEASASTVLDRLLHARRQMRSWIRAADTSVAFHRTYQNAQPFYGLATDTRPSRTREGSGGTGHQGSRILSSEDAIDAAMEAANASGTGSQARRPSHGAGGGLSTDREYAGEGGAR